MSDKPRLRGGVGDDTGRPLFPRDIKPRKIGTLNTLADDEDDDEEAGHVATATAPPKPEKTVKTTPAAEPKAEKPKAKKPAKAKAEKTAEPESKVLLVPPPAEAPAAPPPGYVPPEQRAPSLGLADVYSGLVQRRINYVSTTIAFCVGIGILGIGLALGAGLVPIIIAAVVAFAFGCGIHYAIKTSLNKYLGMGMMTKACGFVFGVTLAAACMALDLFIVAIPLMLFLVAAVGAQSLLLEYRVAQLGTGEVQVIEETTQVGTGGFDAPTAVPPAEAK